MNYDYAQALLKSYLKQRKTKRINLTLLGSRVIVIRNILRITSLKETAMADAQSLNKPKGLKSWVYEHIKELILNRQAEYGEQLRIEDLAKKLNISRTTISEALLRLESERLVQITSMGSIITKIVLTGLSRHAIFNM
jgi:response regulator of citrate/malate metabolism